MAQPDEAEAKSEPGARPLVEWLSAHLATDRERRVDRLPASSSHAWGWLVIAAVGFVGGQILALGAVTVVAAANGQLGRLSHLMGEATPPGWLEISELVGLWAGFLGACVAASHLAGTGRLVVDMGLRFRLFDLASGAVVGVVMQLGVIPLVYLPLRLVVPDLDKRLSGPANRLIGGFHGTTVVVIAALTVLVVPVVEEMFFRGVVLQALLRLLGRAGRTLGPLLACSASGLLFGLAHAEGLQLLGLSLFGLAASALAFYARRLGPGIVAHGTFNLVAVISLEMSRTH